MAWIDCTTTVKTEGWFFERMKEHKPMDITDEQELAFKQATGCSICNKIFNPDEKVRDANASQTSLPLGGKVRDHCHFSNQYRGANIILIIHSNFSRFLFSFITREILMDTWILKEIKIDKSRKQNMDFSIQNSEKFIVSLFGASRFKDRFSFFPHSLIR